MPLYSVGSRYSSTTTKWPETVQFNFRRGEWELVAFWHNPSPQEIEEFKSGPCRIGVAVPDDVLLLLYEFGRINGDAPYDWHKLPAAERTAVPDLPSRESRISFFLCLVDADTGVIRALRYVTASPRVSHILVDAIRSQTLRETFNPADYDRRLASVYAKFTTYADLARIGVIDRAGEQTYPIIDDTTQTH